MSGLRSGACKHFLSPECLCTRLDSLWPDCSDRSFQSNIFLCVPHTSCQCWHKTSACGLLQTWQASQLCFVKQCLQPESPLPTPLQDGEAVLEAGDCWSCVYNIMTHCLMHAKGPAKLQANLLNMRPPLRLQRPAAHSPAILMEQCQHLLCCLPLRLQSPAAHMPFVYAAIPVPACLPSIYRLLRYLQADAKSAVLAVLPSLKAAELCCSLMYCSCKVAGSQHQLC